MNKVFVMSFRPVAWTRYLSCLLDLLHEQDLSCVLSFGPVTWTRCASCLLNLLHKEGSCLIMYTSIHLDWGSDTVESVPRWSGCQHYCEGRKVAQGFSAQNAQTLSQIWSWFSTALHLLVCRCRGTNQNVWSFGWSQGASWSLVSWKSKKKSSFPSCLGNTS